MLSGWRIAVFAIATSMTAMQLVFWPPLWIWSGSLGPPAILVAFLVTISLVLAMTELLRLMIFRYEAQAQDFARLNGELIHRNKNALQLLLALIQRGLREPDVRGYFEALPPRLCAWADASELLRFGARSSCELHDLVALALRPFGPERFAVSGPAVTIGEKCATALTMVLHELATNAAKYGALSNDLGCVRIEWIGTNNAVRLIWEESGGPPVSQPRRRGLGSMILRPRSELEQVEVRYARSGVVATLVLRAMGRA